MRNPIDLFLALTSAALAIFVVQRTVTESRTGRPDDWLMIINPVVSRSASPKLFRLRQVNLSMLTLLLCIFFVGLGGHWIGVF